jgi:two-component system response regulator FlrC
VFDSAVRSVESAVPMQVGNARSLSDVAFQSEAQAIITALDSHDGHRGKTASSLGISERTLRYRLASMRESGLIAAGVAS